MRVKVSEATELALNWMVAKCEGYTTGKFGPKWAVVRGTEHWGNESEIAPSYSTDWAQGGPIIEREHIATSPLPDNSWRAYAPKGVRVLHGREIFNWQHKETGPTPLIAAMRCFCASKLGDEVEVPDGLA